MTRTRIPSPKLSEPDIPQMGVFQGVIDVAKVREYIQESLDDLESALEMLNHAVNPELPNPNYLLCTYVDLENALEKIRKAMKEVEKAVKVVMDE